MPVPLPNCSRMPSKTFVDDQYQDDAMLAAYEKHDFTFNYNFQPSVIPKLVARKLRLRTSPVRSMAAHLLPSYLRKSSENGKQRKIRPTSYLDGIRGVASFFVFIHHYALDYFPELHEGYLSQPTNDWIFQLPFIRIIYSGRFMVGLFFVLSGYVLSYKPLQLIREGNTSALLDNLASSVFRRAMRLFLPVILSTYVVMLMVHNGWYGSLFPGIKVPKIMPLGKQTINWLGELNLIMNPYSWANQLWTLPTEFRGSMLIFICLLGLSKAKPWIRMSLISSFAFFSFFIASQWDMALFFCGIVIAEMRHIQNSSTSLSTNDYTTSRLRNSVVQGFWVIAFLFSWFLACWPDYSSHHSPGYIWLSSMTPDAFPGGHGRTRFWTSIAAIVMLLACENNDLLQQPFITPIAQYLGDISFALYIVHIPVCYSIGRVVTVAGMEMIGRPFAGFMLATAFILPFLLWLADVYWRLIDAKSVEFAKWVWVKSCYNSSCK
jgi:peptidoglycan/LPS O-acetylase OafA/YrhL